MRCTDVEIREVNRLDVGIADALAKSARGRCRGQTAQRHCVNATRPAITLIGCSSARRGEHAVNLRDDQARWTRSFAAKVRSRCQVNSAVP
jgi:hypothetical protein